MRDGNVEGKRQWRGGVVTRHWIVLSILGIVAVVGIAVVLSARSHLSAGGIRTVSYTVPAAPRLVAAPGETVYRIDPSHSEVSYSVAERIVGRTAGHASGSTSGIAGDIALNRGAVAASRVGPIVANLEELHSDNNLRDARIRSDFLESHAYPLATFSVDQLQGAPVAPGAGTTYPLEMVGHLTAHSRTIPLTWHVVASFDTKSLTATATTVVKMSALGVGPISLAGLVTTGDDVTLTMKLVATDPSTSTIPTEIAAPGSAAKSAGSSPSFSHEVAPILAANCASCHRSGEVGAEHWVFDTAGDAAKIADGIGVVTKARYMPPWPASGPGLPLAHSKALDPKQVDTLVRWADAGGRLDVPAATPVPPVAGPVGVAPRADISLAMPEPYTGDPAVPNDYRCFVLDPHLSAPTFITGYTVTPQERREIHHAQIFHIDAQQATEGLKRSGADGRPGWQCYAGPGLPSSAAQVRTGRGGFRDGLAGQAGLIAGWVPGQDPVVYPEDSGVLFQPGDAVVFQIHYHYDRAPLPDRSSISFQTAPGTDPIKPLTIVNPLAPVEIPCMPGATAALCDRDAALADAARQYGPAGSFIEPGLLLLCRRSATDLIAGFSGVASSSCDTKVPVSGQLVGAMGHMHTLGKSFRLTLDPDRPEHRILLDIPIWNFDWQMNYQFDKPLHVDAGQTIRMECSWDRSVDPNRTQKYIIFAEGTEDEMCFSTYAVIPDAH